MASIFETPPRKKWFGIFSARDPRKVSRSKTPPLVAYFWDGGEPVAHAIQDISPIGFFLATTERWLLGTLVMMTLQRTSVTPRQPHFSVIVMSKVVRHGVDGVGFEFVPVESTASGAKSGPGSHPADRKTLDKFLHLVKADLAD
jgi:hypothetical protein